MDILKYLLRISTILFFALTISQSNDIVKAKEIYLSYEAYPKRVFTNQRFTIKLKAYILKKDEAFDSIVTTFVDQKNIDITTTKPIWKKSKDSLYFTNISFKVSKQKFKMPLITVALIKDDEIIDYKSLEPLNIEYENIAIDQQLFSNVIAKDLQINSIKTKQYSNNILLCTINIESKDSNIEDFKIQGYKEQGIKHFQNKDGVQNIYYYVLVPSHTKQITFSYYNILLKEFIKISLPIELNEDLVSTQTDLNPYNSNILIYKQILVIFLLLLFIILYFIQKKNIYIVAIAIVLIFLTYLFLPNKKIIIDKDTKVYILPSTKSTVYQTTNEKKLVEIINQKDNFTKVLFQNQTIGWVKQNDK